MKNSIWIICFIFLIACKHEAKVLSNLEKAKLTLDALYLNYSVKDSPLLRENSPFSEDYSATYLASEDKKDIPNPYSYLWPFSGTFSAVNAIAEASKDKGYYTTLNSVVLPGLEEYFDTKRQPAAYSSYINSAPESDRFYDDNVWIGIDFTDAYMASENKEYLDKAKLVWNFVLSGSDSLLGGGIYWCEQKKFSKNTCSNAPGAVYALKLFLATNDSTYFFQGKNLYTWTKSTLQDNSDKLYFDNISLEGKVDERKYAYNSGQMLQAASLLYKITKDTVYLTEAKDIAKACSNYFFSDFTDDKGESFRLINKGNIWFTAVMFRGFTELFSIDSNDTYLKDFQKNLDYAWDHSRESNGLFNTDWSGQEKDKTKWLLTQAAMVEMYSRMAVALDK